MTRARDAETAGGAGATPARGVGMAAAELGRLLVERAYLEGDFVLRSGRRSRYYLDKYRFETDPALLAPLGAALATLVRRHAPEAELLAGPELGAVPLAAVTSIEIGLPYVIVRKAAKDYGTGNRVEGVWRPGQEVCVVEDIVTSAGALIDSVQALRGAGLAVAWAVCVLDREEGGAAAAAAAGVALAPLFTRTGLGLAGP
jgi:orotate phosphoribosyltransferase